MDREAARVLLLDGADRVLLFHGCDPARPEAGWWWFTPGGGAEGGETPGADGRRELWEETGCGWRDLEGPVAERTAEFDFDGVAYRQHEHYFVARLVDADVAPARPRTPSWRPAPSSARAGGGPRSWPPRSDGVHPGWLGAWLPRGPGPHG